MLLFSTNNRDNSSLSISTNRKCSSTLTIMHFTHVSFSQGGRKCSDFLHFLYPCLDCLQNQTRNVRIAFEKMLQDQHHHMNKSYLGPSLLQSSPSFLWRKPPPNEVCGAWSQDPAHCLARGGGFSGRTEEKAWDGSHRQQ